MNETAACLKCKGAISASRRADSRYCSESCKLAATYERKRLQTRLAELERGLSTARMCRFPKEQLTRIQREVDQAEGRLKVLLGG
jgi:hypothetical protein